MVVDWAVYDIVDIIHLNFLKSTWLSLCLSYETASYIFVVDDIKKTSEGYGTWRTQDTVGAHTYHDSQGEEEADGGTEEEEGFRDET